MPYFGQKIKSTLHKERALRSVDLTKQTITLVIRIIAAFCDGYVKKQFENRTTYEIFYEYDANGLINKANVTR